MLSRISYLGGWKIGVENAVSNLEFGGGVKFGAENAISKLQFGGVENLGGKCYLESLILRVENLGWKMLSRISNLGCGKFGVENAISNLEFGGGGWKICGGKCYLESPIFGVENLGWKMLSRNF